PRRPPHSPHFPYTTLFRSGIVQPWRLSSAMEHVAMHARHGPGLLVDRARVLHQLVWLERMAEEGPAVGTLGHHPVQQPPGHQQEDRKSTRLNSSHVKISYA